MTRKPATRPPAMHLDLVDLRLFVNISKENSLTRGAERSHMSLPAASARVKNLEDDIGVKLVYRTGMTPGPHAICRFACAACSCCRCSRGSWSSY